MRARSSATRSRCSLGAVGFPPAVLLELAAVVLDSLYGSGAELVGVAGALESGTNWGR